MEAYGTKELSYTSVLTYALALPRVQVWQLIPFWKMNPAHPVPCHHLISPIFTSKIISNNNYSCWEKYSELHYVVSYLQVKQHY